MILERPSGTHGSYSQEVGLDFTWNAQSLLSREVTRYGLYFYKNCFGTCVENGWWGNLRGEYSVRSCLWQFCWEVIVVGVGWMKRMDQGMYPGGRCQLVRVDDGLDMRNRKTEKDVSEVLAWVTGGIVVPFKGMERGWDWNLEFGLDWSDLSKYSSGDVKLAAGNTIMQFRINARAKDISLAITTNW